MPPPPSFSTTSTTHDTLSPLPLHLRPFDSDRFALPVIPFSNARTLILTPPSLASNPTLMQKIHSLFPSETTDFQMLDRLALPAVTLPARVYSVVFQVYNGKSEESAREGQVEDAVLEKVHASMIDNARWVATPAAEVGTQGMFGFMSSEQSKLAAVLNGFEVVPDTFGFDPKLTKRSAGSTTAVPLRRKTKAPDGESNGLGNPMLLGLGKGKKMGVAQPPLVPVIAGVGFSDDIGMGDDDEEELIDEDTLLDDADLVPVTMPEACRPKPGKRKRACKDCTCGQKELDEAYDTAIRDKQYTVLKAKKMQVKLESDDLAEVDFTVPGKTGSCGNCSLGDAFRCTGCPYLGLPAFKPGEEVRLVNDFEEDQF